MVNPTQIWVCGWFWGVMWYLGIGVPQTVQVVPFIWGSKVSLCQQPIYLSQDQVSFVLNKHYGWNISQGLLRYQKMPEERARDT